MPRQVTAFRVFIASPGGLSEERGAFRSALNDYNEVEAHARDVAFHPIGWELAIEGMGRPQGIINEEVRGCDYMVVVLQDRWGTPPALGDHAYTSGTEEEYGIARECLESRDRPMRDIVVMFKGVDPRQLSDPGDELKRVLEFRKQLEQEKSALFVTFDTVDEFRDNLRKHLARWRRDHEDGVTATPPGGVPSPPSAALPPPPPSSDTASVAERAAGSGDEEDTAVERVKALARAERWTEAEALLARELSRRDDPATLTQFARLMRRSGRLAAADQLSERLLETGRSAGDVEAQVEAYLNLGISRRKQGQLEASENYLRSAVELLDGGGPDKVLGFALDNLGLTLRRRGDLDTAAAMFDRAIVVRQRVGDQEGTAYSFNHLGFIARERGDMERALRMHESALAVFRDIDDSAGIAQALSNVASDREAVGDLEGAFGAFADALSINESIPSATGIAMNLAQMSRVKLAQGESEESLVLATKSLEASERAGNREGVASALHASGRANAALGNTERARTQIEGALSAFREINHATGSAGTLLDVIRLDIDSGRTADLEPQLAQADAEISGLGVRRLSDQLEALRERASQLNDATAESS